MELYLGINLFEWGEWVYFDALFELAGVLTRRMNSTIQVSWYVFFEAATEVAATYRSATEVAWA